MNKLPEKWCIKLIERKREEIRDYFYQFSKRANVNAYNWYYYMNDKLLDYSSYIPCNYIEISYSDFERLVLNKNNDQVINNFKYY